MGIACDHRENPGARTNLELQLYRLLKPSLTLPYHTAMLAEVLSDLTHLSYVFLCSAQTQGMHLWLGMVQGTCCQTISHCSTSQSLHAMLGSIHLTPAFLFCCIRWNYSLKLLRKTLGEQSITKH